MIGTLRFGASSLRRRTSSMSIRSSRSSFWRFFTRGNVGFPPVLSNLSSSTSTTISAPSQQSGPVAASESSETTQTTTETSSTRRNNSQQLCFTLPNFMQSSTQNEFDNVLSTRAQTDFDISQASRARPCPDIHPPWDGTSSRDAGRPFAAAETSSTRRNDSQQLCFTLLNYMQSSTHNEFDNMKSTRAQTDFDIPQASCARPCPDIHPPWDGTSLCDAGRPFAASETSESTAPRNSQQLCFTLSNYMQSSTQNQFDNMKSTRTQTDFNRHQRIDSAATSRKRIPRDRSSTTYATPYERRVLALVLTPIFLWDRTRCAV
jgi:hypothetical protein